MDLLVTRYPTAGEFLAATEPFLLAREVVNNLILGIARDLAVDASSLRTGPYFAAVVDGEGACLAGFQTLPGRVAITGSRTRDAIALLARDVDAACPQVDAIIGPDPDVEEFARSLAARRGLRAEVRMRQRIHELRQVASLSGLPAGELRLARAADAPLLERWLGGFQEEIGEPDDVSRSVARRVAAEELFLWDHEGPRSMAGWSGRTPNGVRVNAVYSPPELRGRGYATATVAALSRRLLEAGHRFCCLYTDLANSTSNAIYYRIGYRPVSDSSVYLLRA